MKIHSKVSIKRLTSLALTLALVFFAVPSLIVNATYIGEDYVLEHSSLEETLADGKELAVEIAAEGMVLLKNEGDILPLEGLTNISVFGDISQNPFYNGSGSGGMSGITPTSVYNSLEGAGFVLNPELKDLYVSLSASGNIKTGSSGQSGEQMEVNADFTDVRDSYADYSDAAIIFIGRGGGEGGDLKRANVPGHSDVTEHSLELNDAEEAVLAEVKASGEFDKIIYVINSAAAFELTVLEDDPAVDAILWAGMPGGYGFEAIGQILNGTVNPSGRTSAIYPANFKQDPTWFNVGNLNQIYGADNGSTAEAYGDSYSGTPYMFMKGNAAYQADRVGYTIDENGMTVYQAMDYAEGIYMGYRWFETAAIMDGYYMSAADAASDADVQAYLTETGVNYMPDGEDDLYYNRYNGVVYPFGYGLSYSSFEWTVGTPSPEVSVNLAPDTEISIPVTVENTGDVAGKDVVQIYSNPPYSDGGIEKAAKNLITFAKTDLLAPGETQELVLTFQAKDLADFDWNDANDNGFQGYELEAGDYDIYVSANSHDVIDTVTYTVSEGINYDGSSDALNYNFGYGVNSEAILSQDDIYNSNRAHFLVNEEDDADIYVSRSDWGLPRTRKEATDLLFTDETFDVLLDQVYYGGSDDEAGDAWMDDFAGIPESWTQAATVGANNTQLSEMIGVPFDDESWIPFMNQLTWDEIAAVVSSGSYSTAALNSVGKPRTSDQDGPNQTANGYTSWPSEPVQAATFNVDLGYRMGQLVGEESFFSGNTGWYGPGANTNRSPFGGRNFEYYSQDGILAGIYGASVVRGATEKGVIVYTKHMGLNDQESYRYGSGGVSAFANEQAIRQIYMRPWEYMVKYGHLNSTMTSFNKVGLIQAANNYRITTTMMRDEWGFEGHMVTDMYSGDSGNRWGNSNPAGLLVRNGVIPLGGYSSEAGRYVEGTWNAETGMVQVPDELIKTNWVRTNDVMNNSNLMTATTSFSATLEDSPSQWYFTRLTAQRILYVVANSNAMEAGRAYTVNFDPNFGEEAVDTALYASGDSLVLPENPMRPGYTFTGWYSDADATQIAKPEGAVMGSATYYAGWVISEGAIEITFDLNYWGAPEKESVLIAYGSKAPVPATPEREGYDFMGWYFTPGANAGTDIDFGVSIYNDTTIYAAWAPAHVSVTFNMNGAGGNSNQSLVGLNSIGSQLPADPTRDGYLFTGWFTDNAASTYADLSAKPEAGDTLYAGWLDVSTDLFISEYIEGSSNSKAIEIYNPTGADVDLTPYVLDLYVNGGSDVASTLDLSGTLAAGEVFVVSTDQADAAILAEADEQLAYPSVAHFNGDDALALTKDGAIIDLIGVVGTDPGDEWAVGDGSTKEHTLVRKVDVMHGSAVFAPAQWDVFDQNTFDYIGSHDYVGINDVVEPTYHLNYPGAENFSLSIPAAMGQESVFMFGRTFYYDVLESVIPVPVPEVPTRVGYNFTGWYLDSSAETPVGEAVLVADGGWFGPDAVLDFYAGWEPAQINVSFDRAFDGAPAPVVVPTVAGTMAQDFLPDAPTRLGYTFVGWFKDADLRISLDPEESFLTDTVLYAKWQVNSYDVTFDFGEGMDPVVQSVPFEGSPVLPEHPENYGMLFANWYDNAELSGQPVSPEDLVVTADTTFYALWLDNNFDVTFNENYEGSDQSVVVVANGDAVAKPTDPARADYVFTGWFTDDTLTSQVDFDSEIVRDTTYYAGWEAVEQPSGVGREVLVSLSSSIGTLGIAAGAFSLIRKFRIK